MALFYFIYGQFTIFAVFSPTSLDFFSLSTSMNCRFLCIIRRFPSKNTQSQKCHSFLRVVCRWISLFHIFNQTLTMRFKMQKTSSSLGPCKVGCCSSINNPFLSYTSPSFLLLCQFRRRSGLLFGVKHGKIIALTICAKGITRYPNKIFILLLTYVYVGIRWLCRRR